MGLYYKHSFIPFSDLEEFIKTLDFTHLEEWERDLFQFLLDWFDSSTDHIQVSTSGSTGKPKSIEIKKEDMIKSARLTLNFLDLKAKDKAFLCLPAKFIGGKMMLIRALVGDLDLFIAKPNANPLEVIEEKFEFIALTPLQFQQSIENGKAHALKGINKIIIGGGSLSSALSNEISNWTNDVYLTYGMTETISHIAMSKLSMTSDNGLFKLVSDQFQISRDNRECLVISSPYHHAKEIVTNDLITIKDENHFKWKGRIDNVINSGGIKINSEELERKVEIMFDRNFFFAGLPDEKLGEKLVLIIEGVESTNPENIKEAISQVVPTKHHIPKEVIFIKRFIYTDNQKINRLHTLKSIQ